MTALGQLEVQLVARGQVLEHRDADPLDVRRQVAPRAAQAVAAGQGQEAGGEKPEHIFSSDSPLPSDDDTDQLVLDADDLADRLAAEGGQDLGQGQGLFFELLFGEVPDRFEPVPDLPVDLDDDGHGLLPGQGGVIGRPRRPDEDFGVARLLPELLGDVRGEGRKEQDERLQGRAQDRPAFGSFP